MTTLNTGLLPAVRPDITITQTEEPPFSLDFRELAWWFAVLEVGHSARWGIYDPPEWRLTWYYDLETVRPARVHDLEGVEITGLAQEVGGERTREEWSLFGRLTDTQVQCLATLTIRGGVRRIYTLLDEGFDADWGERARWVRPTGRFTRQPDGSYAQRAGEAPLGTDIEAMDVWDVRIADRAFACLRVLSVDAAPTETSVLMEAYLTRDGRTVLCRRYNGREWHRGAGGPYAGQPPWDERFPTHQRLVIDGVTFVHWYDCLSELALGG